LKSISYLYTRYAGFWNLIAALFARIFLSDSEFGRRSLPNSLSLKDEIKKTAPAKLVAALDVIRQTAPAKLATAQMKLGRLRLPNWLPHR
jgi:hypothetical protein